MNLLISEVSKQLKAKSRSRTHEIPHKPMSAPTDIFLLPEQQHDPREAINDGQLIVREMKVHSVEELGSVFSSSTFVKRDLGFQGNLGRDIVLTYGDTIFTDSKADDTFRGMVCNSLAVACSDPIKVFDPALDDSGYPDCLLKPDQRMNEDPNTYSLGITNIVETSPGKGISITPQRSSVG